MKTKWQSFLKTHASGFRLLKIVKDIDRDLIPLSLIESVVAVSMPYVSIVFTAQIIDLLLSKAFDQALYWVIAMLVTVFILGILKTLLSYRTRLSERLLQSNLEIGIRKKSLELEYEVMGNSEVQKALRNAEEAAKYRGGLGSVVKLYKELLQYLLSSATSIVFIILFCMAKGESESGLLAVLSNPILIVVALIGALYLGMKLSKKQSDKIQAIENNIASKHHEVENQIGYWIGEVIMDTESGKTIRMNDMASMIIHNMSSFMKRAIPLYESMGTRSDKIILVGGIESGLFSLVAYGVVCIKVFTKAITTGAFMKYTGALLQFHQAISKLLWSEVEVTRLIKILEPLADYMDRENQLHTGTLPLEKREDGVYELEFHNVSFSYPNTDQYILKNINAKISNKSKMAVVGPNGAGKTTFIKLLCRLYDPTEGTITLNGIDIRKYDYEEYLSLFGVVFQDFFLFSSSIAENVAAEKDFDVARVSACLEKSGVLDFVSSLSKGLDTIIENGDEDAVDLSGGQCQKISIARALYKDAPYVILDEPTAALDPISEAEIYEKFDEMVKNKTSIYISHRMSSCRFCDEILVFDEGKLSERGHHDQLVSKEGLYSKLWHAQAQYYAEVS